MTVASICEWLMERQHRVGLLSRLLQPLTVAQIAGRESLNLDRAGYLVWEFATHKVVVCLNSSAKQCRVYGLSALGLKCQRRVRERLHLPESQPEFPEVNWDIYGWVCYRHRSAIVKALDHPMNPVQIKRRARMRDERTRMSANNVRDALGPMQGRGVVNKVEYPDERHPRYELTRVGRSCRELLLAAESYRGGISSGPRGSL